MPLQLDQALSLLGQAQVAWKTSYHDNRQQRPRDSRIPRYDSGVAELGKAARISSVGVNRALYTQHSSWPLSRPVSAFENQDTAIDDVICVPPSKLHMTSLENASFVIGNGLDGFVFTDECYVDETGLFSYGSKPSGFDPNEIAVGVSKETLEEVFIGFDCGWGNYFHWICFAIAKSYLANRILPSSCDIIMPDYSDRVRNGAPSHGWRLKFTEKVWRESLELAGLADRVRHLPKGVYRAKVVHLFWCQPNSPTSLFSIDVFYRIFQELRAKLRVNASEGGERIFISRRLARDSRINAGEQRIIEEELVKRDFAIVQLESMSFLEQARMFNKAEIVVGAHGAGLTNILFGSERLRILELNRRLERPAGMGSPRLRPWFYLLAAQRNLSYSFIDGTHEGFSVKRVLSGVDHLLSG
jgi:hypothetical protein